jgi:tRNA G37 N-methylase TrmD
MGMRFEIVTIFPGFFTSIFENGIVRRALAEGLVEVGIHDLRAFTHDRHRTVDDRPFGGGEGMVLKAQPIAEALESLGIGSKNQGSGIRDQGSVVGGRGAGVEVRRPCVILLSAQGRPFTQGLARELARLERVVLICGRYEGVDERINELYCDMELSIGDYVLSGGELAAAVVMDATMRLIARACWATRLQGSLKALALRMRRLRRMWRGFRVRSMARAACWIIRTTRGQRSFAGFGAGGSVEWGSPADSALAAGTAVAEDAEESAGFAGEGRAEQRRRKAAGGDPAAALNYCGHYRINTGRMCGDETCILNCWTGRCGRAGGTAEGLSR